MQYVKSLLYSSSIGYIKNDLGIVNEITIIKDDETNKYTNNSALYKAKEATYKDKTLKNVFYHKDPTVAYWYNFESMMHEKYSGDVIVYEDDGSISCLKKYLSGSLLSEVYFVSETFSYTEMLTNDMKKREIDYKRNDLQSHTVYKNGIVISSYNTKNREFHGIRIEYFDDGKEKSRTYYENGKKYGLHTEKNKDGIKVVSEMYTEGIPNGVSKLYYNNGIPKRKTVFHLGMLYSIKNYFEDGSLESEIILD